MLRKRFTIVLITAMLLLSCFNFNIASAAEPYVRPYVYNIKVRPFLGADLNDNNISGDRVNTEGFMITWDHVGTLSWSELVVSETPITYTDGTVINFEGTSFDPSNSTHSAMFQHVYDNYYKLDRNSIIDNNACQSAIYINQSCIFYKGNDRIYPFANPLNTRGKTYYFALLLCGQDPATNSHYWYIGDMFEYTTANTIAVTPNGLSNTIKYALVQNDNTNYFHESEGMIFRWDSYADYLASNVSKQWYVKYTTGVGYKTYVRDITTGELIKEEPTSQSFSSYGTFVDSDITADPGTVKNYYYQIYQSNIASHYTIPDYNTTSTVPGPLVAIDHANDSYITDIYGSPVFSGIDFAIWAVGGDGSGFTDHPNSNPDIINYRSHYRWTVISVYTSYLNTCPNISRPEYDANGNITSASYHNGQGECGNFFHPNPTVTKGGRLGKPYVQLVDSKNRIVTDATGGGLMPENETPSGVVCYDSDGNAYYDPCNVAFSFSTDWRETPLALDRGVFPSDPTQSTMDLVTSTDLMRGCTYLFVFTSCYEYDLGEAPPGWNRAITQADIDARSNQIFGHTYVYYTVPYVNTQYNVTVPNSDPVTFSYNTFGNIPQTNNTPIDVTVSWTDFEYTLYENWNPDTHKYEYAFAPTNSNGGKLTVTNNGLADITTHIECNVPSNISNYVYGYWYDPLVPSNQRQWLNTQFKPDGVHVSPSAAQQFQLFMYASSFKDNYATEFGRDQASIIKNNPVIGTITVSINEKYKFIT